MNKQWHRVWILFLLILTITIIIDGTKPNLLACDTYASSSSCLATGVSSNENDCETCCGMLLERMYDCPPCRHFVLNARRQSSLCFCTVCFKQYRHRRRHQSQQQQLEQNPPSRFDY